MACRCSHKADSSTAITRIQYETSRLYDYIYAVAFGRIGKHTMKMFALRGVIEL